VPSSAIGRVIESTPGSVLENILGGVLGTYSECTWERLESVSQAGWVCTIECNQECISERTWERAYISAYKCIWQFGFKFVECSMMYSIKRT
jgi:hypothetical protein